MNKELIVQRDSHMQFFAGEAHENKISGLELRSCDGTPDPKLRSGDLPLRRGFKRARV